MGIAIHIYHNGADAIQQAVARADPTRTVIVCSDREGDATDLEAEVLFAVFPPFAHLAAARNLRLIQLLSTAPATVLDPGALRPGVQLAGLGDTFAAETSEYVLSMMLAHCRAIPTLLERQARKQWRAFPASSLEGATVAILGLGGIGRRVARLARAFGMRVIGMRSDPEPVAHVEEVVGPDRLHWLLPQADFVVVAVPLTTRTQGLLDADALAHLRPHAMLINVARGGVVDEDALLDSLRGGRLGAAALDVFGQEPLAVASPLWDAPNTIVTPHVAGHGRNYTERAVSVLLANVERLERGEPIVHRIDPERGY